jgi:hypothetical protein
MTPRHAIAECEWPLKCAFAAGVNVYPDLAKCYESFTLKVLSIGPPPRIFPGVMTEAFTNISRGAGAAVRALRGNYRPRQFSAHNLLSLTSGFRPLTSDI